MYIFIKVYVIHFMLFSRFLYRKEFINQYNIICKSKIIEIVINYYFKFQSLTFESTIILNLYFIPNYN